MLQLLIDADTREILETLPYEEGSEPESPVEFPGRGTTVERWEMSLEELEDRAAKTYGGKPPRMYINEAGGVWGGGLDDLKARKRRQMDGAFHAECDRDFGSPYVAMALIVARATNDPRLSAATQRAEKLRSKYQEIEAATTPAGVEWVTW